MNKLVLVAAASAVLISCSPPGGLVGALTPQPSTQSPSPPPTHTATLRPSTPTAIRATATPVSPAISADSIGALANFASFGQGAAIRNLVFTPDGATLALGGGNTSDFAIRLWDRGSGKIQGVLEGHGAIIWDLAFSPDGGLLASASQDWTARIWDWRAGEVVQTLDLPSDASSAAFSPDGRVLAVGGVEVWPNASVWMWSVDDWQPLMKLSEFWNIPALAFSPDGNELVGGGTSRNVRVWRVSDGAVLFILQHSGQVSSLAISPDGSTLATGLCEASQGAGECVRGAIWLWDLSNGKLMQRLSDFADWVEAVAFSVDGSVVIGGARDGELIAYSTSSFQPVFTGSSPGGVAALAISPDGRLLATGGSYGFVYLWRVEP